MNLIMRLNIMEKSRGIPNFLNDCTTSCIGLIEDNNMIDVKVTIIREKSKVANIKP